MKKISQTLLLICFLGWVTPTTTTAQILAERLNLREKDPNKITSVDIDAAKDGDLLPILSDEAPYLAYLTITNLETFPKELYELKFLQRLTITNSTFTTMPEFQGWPQWVNLRGLHIQAQLTSVPERMSEMINIVDVSLYKNQLEEIPKAFIDNPYIITLDLSLNRIQKIDTAIKKMTSLKRLFLIQNQITHLPAAVFHLPSLEQVRLSKNLIQSMDNDIQEFCPVEKIDLETNKLEEVPVELNRLKNLYQLNLFENPLKDISEEIWEGKSYIEIYIGFSKMTQERQLYLINKYRNSKIMIYIY